MRFIGTYSLVMAIFLTSVSHALDYSSDTGSRIPGLQFYVSDRDGRERHIMQQNYGLEAPTFFKKDLKNLIENRKITRIDQLLPLLPEPMRIRSVIIFKSRSLQEASPLLPRVLLFNEDASLVISFNGDRSQVGYEALEVMSFDHQNFKFEFEEFVFQGDLADREDFLTARKLFQDAAALKNRETRTGVNPPVCLVCHRSNPRPNWESYSAWPGVYGQIDHNFPITSYLPNQPESQEFNNFKKFLDSFESNKRYSSIVNKENYNSEKRMRGVPSMNSMLTQALALLNFRRLAKDLICHPNYHQFRPLFRKQILDGDFYGEREHFLRVSKAELDRFVNETLKLQEKSQEDNLEEAIKNLGNNTVLPMHKTTFKTIFTSKAVAGLRFLMEKRLNMDLSSYEMAFKRGTYDFVIPGSESLADLYRALSHLEKNLDCSKFGH